MRLLPIQQLGRAPSQLLRLPPATTRLLSATTHRASPEPAAAPSSTVIVQTSPATETARSPAAAGQQAYHVSRTASDKLPVYQDLKNGGNRRLTLVRKISGDSAALMRDLQQGLGLPRDKIKVNPVTRHVVLTVSSQRAKKKPISLTSRR